MKNSINFIYKLVYNAKAGMYVPVAETSSSQGGKRRALKAALFSALFASHTAWADPLPDELPTGATITSGSATLTQTSNSLTINQTTDKLITNWNTFNIGSDAMVKFVQPSSSATALNRVVSNDPSKIFGSLQANGKVILVNTNGVYFAPGSHVNTAGFTASTLDIQDQDFLNNIQKYVNTTGTPGEIHNLGDIISTEGSYIAFIAPVIKNDGVLKAPNGSVLLAAADEVSVSFDPQGLIKFTIDKNTVGALIEHNNLIEVGSGTALLSAKAVNTVTDSVIKVTGEISANSLTQKGGRIMLGAEEVTLSASSKLEAKGAAGGGQIQVGGSWQNSDTTVAQATKTTMEAGAMIDASATNNGDGGQVVLWSDITKANSVTEAHGTIFAKGGTNGGDGGQIETSGHYLNLDGVDISTLAYDGLSGKWLIDPNNVTIGSTGVSSTYSESSGMYTAISSSTTIALATIQSALQGGDVSVITNGDIIVNQNINFSGVIGKTLYLNAGQNISLQGTIDGDFSLDMSVGSTGKIVFNQQIGGTTALSSVTTGVNGTTYINADVTTSGFQTYQNALIIGVQGVAQFVNGDFSSGLTGWTASNTPVYLGTTQIGGFTSPIDSTKNPTLSSTRGPDPYPTTNQDTEADRGTFAATGINTTVSSGYVTMYTGSGSMTTGF
ncbi:MAG: hypothetical protein RLZZ428_1183, partial [Pseudomonadota bacterium]